MSSPSSPASEATALDTIRDLLLLLGIDEEDVLDDDKARRDAINSFDFRSTPSCFSCSSMS
jgi:hypothetical protein